MTIRKYPRSGRRTIVDLAEVLAQKDEYAVVCVSRGALNIVRKLLLPRGHWLTSYAKSYEMDGYEPATEADMNVVEEILAEFMEGTAVNCSELLDELAAIGAAITAGGASGGCGCGTTGTPTDEVESTEDTGDILNDSEPTPPGFANRPEYRVYKCDVADWIVDNHLTDLAWLQGQNLLALTAVVMIAAFITPIPGDGFIALLAFLVALSGIGAGLVAIAYDAINNNYDDLVCALFTGTYNGNSTAQWTAEISDAVDGETANTIYRAYIKTMLGFFLTNGQANKLYVKDAYLDDLVTGQGDCSSCGTPCEDTMVYGSGDFETLEFSSQVWSTGHAIRLYFGAPKDIDVDAITGWTFDSQLGPNHFRVGTTLGADCDDPGSYDVYDSDTPPTGLNWPVVGQFDFRSNTAFTLSLSEN